MQNWEIINTAVLTGKQISHAMKVFVVSYAGKISDVTRQSVCQIEDDSVLKVGVISTIKYNKYIIYYYWHSCWLISRSHAIFMCLTRSLTGNIVMQFGVRRRI